MNEPQLELEGIGQQKATLADWKAGNNIYTFYSENMAGEECPWSCWDEIESPIDFMEQYGCDSIGVGETEKEAIIEFCMDNEIKLPFWW